MRISRRSKKEQPPKINYLYNEGIQAPRILVLNSDGSNIGIMTTAEAIRKARELELDLVEINPKTDPPVAKIMDFGQFRYQKEKEMRLKKAHQHVVEIKGIRLSLRIGKHDSEIRKNQAVKFLNIDQSKKCFAVDVEKLKSLLQNKKRVGGSFTRVRQYLALALKNLKGYEGVDVNTDIEQKDIKEIFRR
jgi:translation initiation factor IF-3